MHEFSTSFRTSHEKQEISNLPVSHDWSANSNLLFSKSPREVLPVPYSNDLPCYPDNIDPFQPPNLLSESANYIKLFRKLKNSVFFSKM